MDIICLTGPILNPAELNMKTKINPLVTIVFAAMSIITFAIKSFNFIKTRNLYTDLVKQLPRDMVPRRKISCPLSFHQSILLKWIYYFLDVIPEFHVLL